MYYVRMDVNGDGSWEWAYYPSDEDCAAWDMKLKLAMNDPGTFEMTLPRTNPMHGRVVTRRTIVEVLRDGESLFLGEVRDIAHDADMSESIYAVGALAWLCNSTQGQEQFKRISVREFLAYMLAEHNRQCPEHPFTLGMVTIAEPDPDSETLLRYTNYGTTWATIKDRLITRFDETAVRLRRSGATWILDYVNVSDYGVECEQDVRFGENLLDYSDSLTSDDVCSSLIPLGAVINDENGNPSRLGNIIEKRVTIEKVNGGRNYIESPELVERFGHVRVTHTWDGVNTPATLLRKAREWLQDGQWERLSLKVDMVDLAITGEAADAFRMGDRAYVVSEPYGLRKVFPIRSRTYNLDNPEQDSMTLGADVSTSFVSSIVNSAASSALAPMAGRLHHGLDGQGHGEGRAQGQPLRHGLLEKRSGRAIRHGHHGGRHHPGQVHPSEVHQRRQDQRRLHEELAGRRLPHADHSAHRVQGGRPAGLAARDGGADRR